MCPDLCIHRVGIVGPESLDCIAPSPLRVRRREKTCIFSMLLEVPQKLRMSAQGFDPRAHFFGTGNQLLTLQRCSSMTDEDRILGPILPRNGALSAIHPAGE